MENLRVERCWANAFGAGMNRFLIALMVALLALLKPATASAQADQGDHPEFTGQASSVLYPTHLGNYVVGTGDGASTGADMRVYCWDWFAAHYNYLVLIGQEPGPVIDGYPPQSAPEPSYCKEHFGYKIEPPPPGIINHCPPGTVAAYYGFYDWVPGKPFDPPGSFSWRYLSVGPSVDPYLFDCYEIFDPDDDVLSITEAVAEPTFDKSPVAQGLTGLDTWLWYDFTLPSSHTITASTTLNTIVGLPITIEGTAWIDKIEWDMNGDGVWDVDVDFPDQWDVPPPREIYLVHGGDNSEDGAAATYMYEEKGTFDIAVGVTWRGIYTVIVPGFGGTYAYPPVTRIHTEPYVVCEIRPVLGSSDDAVTPGPATCG